MTNNENYYLDNIDYKIKLHLLIILYRVYKQYYDVCIINNKRETNIIRGKIVRHLKTVEFQIFMNWETDDGVLNDCV